MNKRTKTLAITLGAMLAAMGLWQVLYPVLIEPLTTLDQRLESRGEALAVLEDIEKTTKKKIEDYRALASRIGSFDIDRLTTQVRDRINTLIDKHKLVADNVSPSRPIPDRKTKVQTATINVKAVGRLESVIGFLKDVSELPQLSRVGNVAIYPTSTNPGTKEAARVNVRVPIEIKVLPQQKLVGVMQEKDLHPPEAMVRNQGRDYSPLWSARQFFDYVPPAPLVAEAGKDATTHVDKDTALRGSATGGEPPYTFRWSGEAINDATEQNVVVNTKGFTEGDHTYTMTVTDAAGNTATDTMRVTIKPSAVPRNTQVAEVQRPPPVQDPRSPDRALWQIVMMLGRSDSAGSVNELMTQNKTNGSLGYHKVGDLLDNGRLMYVHQTGGLVRRKDITHPNEERWYVYPIGAQLDQDLPVDAAVDYPELQTAAQKISATLPPAEEKTGSPRADAGGDGGSAGLSDAPPPGSIPAGADGQAVPTTALGSETNGTPESVEPARSGAAPRRGSSQPPKPPGRKSRSSRAP